jgi:hypothetical protein
MHDDYNASLTNWIAILSISTRFIFEKVRERAIREITKCLDEIEPFDLIGMAIKYDVETWLKPAYRRIVTRNSLITHKEALRVPLPMAVMLMRSREQHWKYPHSGSRGSVDTMIDAEVRLMELAPKEVPNNNTPITRRGRVTPVASVPPACSYIFGP